MNLCRGEVYTCSLSMCTHMNLCRGEVYISSLCLCTHMNLCRGEVYTCSLCMCTHVNLCGGEVLLEGPVSPQMYDDEGWSNVGAPVSLLMYDALE